MSTGEATSVKKCTAEVLQHYEIRALERSEGGRSTLARPPHGVHTDHSRTLSEMLEKTAAGFLHTRNCALRSVEVLHAFALAIVRTKSSAHDLAWRRLFSDAQINGAPNR